MRARAQERGIFAHGPTSGTCPSYSITSGTLITLGPVDFQPEDIATAQCGLVSFDVEVLLAAFLLSLLALRRLAPFGEFLRARLPPSARRFARPAATALGLLAMTGACF